MNEYQTIALQHPIRLAFEALHDQFKHYEGGLSVIVTINYGYE